MTLPKANRRSRPCKQCGGRYEPSWALQRFCSHQCAYLAARTGIPHTCVVCGTEFYRSPRVGSTTHKHKYCSQVCMGKHQRKQRTCTICGSKFEHGGPRKTCSRKCWLEAGRRAKLGKKNPAYKTGEGEARRRWESQAESACRLCGSNRRLQLHHVVYEQHVRSRHGDVFDPTNSFTICWDCHNKHHRSIDKRIPISSFRPENWVFAKALLGESLPYYLIRYYHAEAPATLIEELS